MDRDNVKGKMDDVKGRIKRQAGEWTGDDNLQAEGAADQLKGKAENAWGKVKDGARNLADDVRQGSEKMKNKVERKSDEAQADDVKRRNERDVA